MLSSIEEYSQAIYAFLDNAPQVRRHTLRIYPRGARLGVMEGTVAGISFTRPNLPALIEQVKLLLIASE